MPHKRAKRSVRERERSEKGHDMAPGKNSLRNEAIPKSAARVLNALKIREDFKAKKRQLGDTNDGRDGKRQKVDDRKKKEEKEKFPGILPGESLQHYNKRVEDSMRPLVRNAMKASLATIRGAKKQELEEKAAKKLLAQEKRQNEDDESSADPPPSLSSSKHAGKPKEFQVLPSSAPKRLNDIVQAPPEMIRLKNARRSSDGYAATNIGGKRDGVISMAQKQMMEAEREKAIARYRQLKAAKRKDGDIGGDN